MTEFSDADGWSRLRTALADPFESVRRKTAFLLGQLIIQDASTPGKAPAPRSSSTAMMPADNQPHQDSSVFPSAPLEEGPATLKLGTDHPDVAAAMLKAGIPATLLGTILSPTTLQTALNTPDLAQSDRDIAQAARAAAPQAYTCLLYTSPSPRD